MHSSKFKAKESLLIPKFLPRDQKDAAITQIANNREIARGNLDLATIAMRESEPSRSFREYLGEKAK